MFTLVSNLICAALLSTTPVTEPTEAKALSFNASAYVNAHKQIRVAVEKKVAEPVVVLLRNDKKDVIFERMISKKDLKFAIKLDVAELGDGQYELEVKASDGSIRKQVNLTTQPIQAVRTIAVK